MFILHCLLCSLCGFVLVSMGYLPCHWEWWVIVLFVLESTFYGFHLGMRYKKTKEENNNESN